MRRVVVSTTCYGFLVGESCEGLLLLSLVLLELEPGDSDPPTAELALTPK
jgi:hypothetical protein